MKADVFNPANGILLLDGAMGTMIQKADLPPVPLPEYYNIEQPEAIVAIHRAYIDAGAKVIYASTFGASPHKYEQERYTYDQVIEAGIANAKKAAKGSDVKVALDLGPLGVLMEPMGKTTFEDAYQEYAQMVTAGVAAGADLIVIETMTDLYEAKAALRAAKENSDLPVLVTMTFEASGRTFMGTPVEAATLTLEANGADAIGINCSLGPDQLLPLLERLCKVTALPVAAKPNAGLPDPFTGHYHLPDDEFARTAAKFMEAGVSILGGCCGTTPATIQALDQLIARHQEQSCRAERTKQEGICSALRVLDLDGIRVVGERINPTGKKRLQQALLEGDLDLCARLAIEQKEAGADLLDVNVGMPGVDEVSLLPAVVRKIQSVCDLPLLLDSSNPKALEAALRVVNGKAAINSVNGKQESLDAILPLAARYHAPLVALCLDENGLPDTAQKRIAIAKRIADEAAKYGIDRSLLWFDCLSLTISAQQDQARETLKAITWLKDNWKARTILGVSNISFGLPARPMMNQTFLTAAMQAGLNFAIINPSLTGLMDAVACFKAISGEDEGLRDYVARFANRPDLKPVPAASMPQPVAEENSSFDHPLQAAIYKGLSTQAAKEARALLAQGQGELELTETHLIPALDWVGKDYEQGKLYLPSLLQAASAAQAVFEVLKESMAAKGEKQTTKGTIVLATVQGDIHDIGKNIVKTLLENYGYSVIDLGKDVAPETVVEAVVKHQAPLVGLSALMTTTLPAMEKTIEQLHQLANPPKIMVGGAVVTPEAAIAMGADYYCKDAREDIAVADEVFGTLASESASRTDQPQEEQR